MIVHFNRRCGKVVPVARCRLQAVREAVTERCQRLGLSKAATGDVVRRAVGVALVTKVAGKAIQAGWQFASELAK